MPGRTKTIAEALSEPGVVMKREEVIAQIQSWVDDFDIAPEEIELTWEGH